MKPIRKRTTETIIYTVVWIVVFGLCLLDVMHVRTDMSLSLLDWMSVWKIVCRLAPFFILFVINNNVLIPRLLLRNSLTRYFIATVLVLLLVGTFQYVEFMHRMSFKPLHAGPEPPFRPLIPLPLVLDFTYSVLVVGVNLAIALIFQRFDDKLERESLMKANAENQLAYLKAQINPHFYMNMLNNIHGMIDINPARAQSMLIDMSQLMRYMLYDSSRERITLAGEIAFLKNYLGLMRQRYPDQRVSITASYPDEVAARGIMLPPLLFLVFIENAFKHGISYRNPSFVAIAIEVTEGGTLHFSCMNSIHPAGVSDKADSTGIGLVNIRRRLGLIYGQDAVLEIDTSQSVFTVNLFIPINENKDSDN